MEILAQSEAYEAGAALGKGIGVIFLSLLFLFIPALILKFSAKLIEKTDVSVGNAYGVMFMCWLMQGAVILGIRLWGVSVGEDYARTVVALYGRHIALTLFLLMFLATVSLVAMSFELTFVGGLKVVLAPIVVAVAPFVLMLSPLIFRDASQNTVQHNHFDPPPNPGIAPPPAHNFNLAPPKNPFPGNPLPPVANPAAPPAVAANPPAMTLPEATPPRRKESYPINIIVPPDCIRVPDDAPVKPGLKLKACWGNKWNPVTVKEVNPDGTLFIHWEDYSDTWNSELPRNQLIISKAALKRITAATPTPPSTSPSDSSPTTTETDSPSRDSSPSNPPVAENDSKKYKVVLTEVGKEQVQVAKAFGKLQDLSLSDSLEFLRTLPVTLKRNLSQTDARKIADEFQKLGASVTLEAQ